MDDDLDETTSPRRRVLAPGVPSVTQQIGPWVVTYSWPKDADQGGPWAVTITPSPDATDNEVAGGIASTLVRQIDFRAAGEEWRAKSEHIAERDERIGKRQSAELRSLVANGITDEYLATLAQTYVRLVMTGEKSIVRRLAELVDKSPETIKIHLKEARKRDLLTTVKGRAGGHLTSKSRQILDGLQGRKPRR